MQTLQQIKQKYKKLSYKHQNNPKLYKNIIKFFDYLKLYKISLTQLSINKQLLKATITANQQANFYSFISAYEKNIKINKIYKEKNFYMDIQIEF